MTSDQGRLTREEVERMMADAEKYAEDDKATAARIASRNALENYAFNLKNQLNDVDGLGGRLDGNDKEIVGTGQTRPSQTSPLIVQLLEAIEETTSWLVENSATASTEDYEQQKEQLSDVAYPITSKLYDVPEEDGDVPFEHTEL
jgi:endoplasmic reticulum chaperone BiP